MKTILFLFAFMLLLICSNTATQARAGTHQQIAVIYAGTQTNAVDYVVSAYMQVQFVETVCLSKTFKTSPLVTIATVIKQEPLRTNFGELEKTYAYSTFYNQKNYSLLLLNKRHLKYNKGFGCGGAGLMCR